MAEPEQLRVDLPEVYKPLFGAERYKAMRGGRGAARSWTAATALVAYARSGFERILCTREYQSTIRESVHYLLKARISAIGVAKEFYITDNSIQHMRTGSEFIFKGLRHDPDGIKSLEGITKVWIEEARTVSKTSLQILNPTIRAPGSQIWATWNPEDEDDPIEAFYENADPHNKVVLTTTYRDNPFFPPDLEEQRLDALRLAQATGDWDDYDWIWEGEFRRISEAAVFRRRVVIEDFNTPEGVRFYHGADWGFASDPTALVRCYTTHEPDGEHLWIDQEAFGNGVEIDETPQLFQKIQTSRKWPIKADSARPETISAMKRAKFNITAAKKWPGSVEDGIAHIKGYVKIHIHVRCKHMTEEAKKYSFKVDKLTQEVLPVLIDKWNHGWDAVRYSLDGIIRNSSAPIVSSAALAKSTQPGLRNVTINSVPSVRQNGFSISQAALERSRHR